MTGWEHFPHGADVGVRGRGPSREAAFAEAALALTAAITDPDAVRPSTPVAIRCADEGADDLLLLDWLNAVIYEMATRRMLCARFELGTEPGALVGTAWGEPVDAGRHAPAAEPKGATFTALSVHRDGGDWVAQCVIDV